MLIEVVELRKRLGGRTILDGVSFTVPKGQTVLVTGPSGTGKTTLLRCLNGLEQADAGTVRIGDTEIRPGGANTDRTLSAIRRRIGFVFQQWNLFAHQTVLENVVEAPIHVAGLARAATTDRARALLARVGIEHRGHALPHELSGGEQQRAAIARALAMQPEALMLDEPTSALDRERADDLLGLLRALGAGGLTLIVVTHDPRVPAALGGRVLALEHGKLVGDRASA